MFCPSCRAEYRDGFSICADCGAALIAQLPTVPPPAPASSLWDEGDLVTLLSSTDPVAILATKASLDLAGIWYFERGRSLQNLLPLGFQGGYSGLIQIQIRSADAEAAMAAVKEAAAEAERNS
jgi:hypothetical protein